MQTTLAATEQKKNIETICRWASGTLLQQHSNANIEELCIDSRKIAHPETALFIAIKTRHRDGHLFISQAYEKGVRSFMVTTNINTSFYTDANFIKIGRAHV